MRAAGEVRRDRAVADDVEPGAAEEPPRGGQRGGEAQKASSPATGTFTIPMRDSSSCSR